MGAALPRRLHGTLYILKALTMTYEVTPVRTVSHPKFDATEVEQCPAEDAEMFSVYFRGEDGLAEWIADFLSHDDAVKFKEMKES